MTAPKKQLYDWIASGWGNVNGWVKVPTYDRGFLSADRSVPVRELVHRVVMSHKTNVPLVWNIEHWRLPGEIGKFIDLIGWAREVRPDLRQGLYSMCPMRSYWAPVERYIIPGNATYEARYAAWLDANRQLAPLAKELDFICPSIYTFYRNNDGHIGRNDEFWLVYARENIEQARSYGKQVIPFLSPRYWAVAGKPPIELQLFKSQVQYALELADGVFLFDWMHNTPKIDLTNLLRELA